MEQAEIEKQYQIESKHWWFKARRRLVLDCMKKFFPSGNDLKILDIASATGLNFVNLKDYGSIHGVDISMDSIRFCRGRKITTIICTDAQELPLKTDYYDVVIALDAFEHFNDDLHAMAEMNRVLKPGGKLILTVPALMMLWSPHDTAFHHVRRYTSGELKMKMIKSGFSIEKLTYWSTLMFFPVFLLRRTRKLFEKQDEIPKSDFFMKVPKIFEILIDLNQKIEGWCIKKGISFPVGVSLFGSFTSKK